MFTTIKTPAHTETLCAQCLAKLAMHGSITREWGEDTITPDMVTGSEANEGAGQCTWCGFTPWLSIRLIARLSPLRRANLERRLMERLEEIESDDAITRYVERLHRASAVLGRACCIISNVEARERSEASHV